MQYLAPNTGRTELKGILREAVFVLAGLMMYATEAMLSEDRRSLRAIPIVASFPMWCEQACLLAFLCNGQEDV